MKQLSFAIPISMTVALAGLERRCKVWGLPPLAYQVLERWYSLGWDDGLVEFDRDELAGALGVKAPELDDGIGLLEDLNIVRVRLALSHEVAELLALSTSHNPGGPCLGWWQVYRVEMQDYSD